MTNGKHLNSQAITGTSHDGKNFAQGAQHAGSLVHCGYRDFLPPQPGLCQGMRKAMTPLELTLALLLAVGLTAYLVYAMLRPEKF